MNTSSERIISPTSVMLIVISALLGSHAMDIGQLIIAVYDLWHPPEQTDLDKKFRVEGGLLVAGVGFVVLLAIGAQTARHDGTVKNYETLLASLVTGFLGLTFSIIDKTAGPTGLPTSDTARGLIFVVIGACMLMPPFFAMPWTNSGLARAATVLLRVAVAAVIAFLLGLIVQAGFSAITRVCEGPCELRLEQGRLRLGENRFYISAPSGGAFMAGMAVLICDPFVRRDRWPQLSSFGRGIWLLSFIGISCLLSALYAVGYYFPKHGVSDTGWLQHASIAKVDRVGTILMLLLLNLPALIAAICCLTIIPLRRRRFPTLVCDLSRAAIAVFFGGCGAFLVVQQLTPLGVLVGKEPYFIAAHAATALSVMVSAIAVYRFSKKSDQQKTQGSAPSPNSTADELTSASPKIRPRIKPK